MMTELKRILHIEDDPSIRIVTRVALENVGGYEVLCCASGPQALERFEDFAPQFILLDVMMPGMDGPQTLLQLRQRMDLANIPVAFMTAKVQPHEIELLRELGGCGVITKPFDPMQLAARIHGLWSQARTASMAAGDRAGPCQSPSTPTG